MTVRLLLLLLAIVCFVVVTIMGFDVIAVSHPTGWLGLGLALFAGSFLP